MNAVLIHTSFTYVVKLDADKWPILARANVYDGPSRKRALAMATVAVRKHRAKEKFFVYGWERLGESIDRSTVPDFVPRFLGLFVESDAALADATVSVAEWVGHPELAPTCQDALREAQPTPRAAPFQAPGRLTSAVSVSP